MRSAFLKLSAALGISLAEVNAGIKRLEEAGLLRKDKQGILFPNVHVAEEFLIHSIKFLFPVKLGEYTRGTPAAIAAPIFRDKIALGNDPIPVWPDAMGEERGVALLPIHPNFRSTQYKRYITRKNSRTIPIAGQNAATCRQ
jgi:hypothetical protein